MYPEIAIELIKKHAQAVTEVTKQVNFRSRGVSARAASAERKSAGDLFKALTDSKANEAELDQMTED